MHKPWFVMLFMLGGVVWCVWRLMLGWLFLVGFGGGCLVDRDVVVQKYLVGKASQLEKDWLLGELLKLYNKLRDVLSKRRKENGVG